MSEDEAKQWVKNKANQDLVVERFFKDYQPKGAKIAFFMAGIPGAGKTEFAENTIRITTPIFAPIEHDKLVEYIEGYKPEDYYNYRKAGSVLVTRIFDECLKNDYAFIFDGTLSHENGLRNIKKTFKAGYKVFVVYIVQDIKMAWELTQAREVVKKRSIEKAGFLDTCNKINDNLKNIFVSFKDDGQFNFWLINKQGDPGLNKSTAIIYGNDLRPSAAIEKELDKSYNLKAIK